MMGFLSTRKFWEKQRLIMTHRSKRCFIGQHQLLLLAQNLKRFCNQWKTFTRSMIVDLQQVHLQNSCWPRRSKRKRSRGLSLWRISLKEGAWWHHSLNNCSQESLFFYQILPQVMVSPNKRNWPQSISPSSSLEPLTFRLCKAIKRYRFWTQRPLSYQQFSHNKM